MDLILGEKKLRKLADDYSDYGFTIQNGAKTLTNRKKFEESMKKTTAVYKQLKIDFEIWL